RARHDPPHERRPSLSVAAAPRRFRPEPDRVSLATPRRAQQDHRAYREVPLQEGDAIVYLSDGTVEAQDENGDPFGFDQLEALLTRQTDRFPDAIRDAILTAIAHHAGTRPADDDRTVMVLRFESLMIASEDAELATAGAAA